MTPELVTTIFLLLLLAGLAVRLLLGWRQIRHVRQHQRQVPATMTEEITLEEHDKAARYALANQRVGLVDAIWGAMVLLFWTLGGGLAWLDRSVATWLDHTWLVGLSVIAGVLVISALLELPFAIYKTFRLEQRFDFNQTTPGLFALDQVKHLLISLALLLPLAGLAIWLMSSLTFWWFWLWLAWISFTLVMTVAWPRFIAPLFNQFEPLETVDLRQRLEALMQRCGFASRGMFVMDASKRSAHGNAYFTGFGRAKRIVLFDTLLEDLENDEVEAVVAHELGHFKLNHIVWRLLLMAVVGLGACYLLGWLAESLAFHSGLGVDRMTPALTLLLFVLALPVAVFWFSPLAAAWSRRHEYQADAFAREYSDASHLASGLIKLTRENAATLTPDPWYWRFYYSHPPVVARLAALRR